MYRQLFTDFCEQKDNLYFMGRLAFEGTAVELSWAASGFYMNFRGTRLVIRTRQDPPANAFENGEPMPVVIRTDLDGVAAKHCLLGTRGCIVLDGLDDTSHTLRLMRASSGCDRVFLERLELGGSDPQVLPYHADFALKLEFLGDSITCGYGMMGTRPLYDSTEEDAAMTYAFLTGEALHADTRLISWSGRGLHCSCGGETFRRFIDLFNASRRTEDLPPYTFGDWIPDCLVVNGGTNDAGGRATADEYRAAALELYERIRQVYPAAKIVFTLGLMGNAYHATLKELEETIRRRDPAFYYFPTKAIYETKEEVGANGHPSFVGHVRAAKELTAYLKTIL